MTAKWLRAGDAGARAVLPWSDDHDASHRANQLGTCSGISLPSRSGCRMMATGRSGAGGKRRVALRRALVACAILLVACATITKGTTQLVAFDTSFRRGGGRPAPSRRKPDRRWSPPPAR